VALTPFAQQRRQRLPQAEVVEGGWAEVDGGAVDRLPPAVESAVYRIVQEALTNVLKHARAATVSVSV
jgi:signal transduction histidine kinase